MSREFYSLQSLNDAVIAQVAGAQIRPVFLLDADFDGVHERLCTINNDITIGSTTWYGAGNILSVSPIDEPYELKSSGVNITISGLDSDILAIALGTNYQNRNLEIRMGFMEVPDPGTGYELIGQSGSYLPPVIFSGRMDVMAIEDTGDACNIQVSVENRLIDFERRNESRYTDNEQLSRYPTDNSLEHVVKIQKRVLQWEVPA